MLASTWRLRVVLQPSYGPAATSRCRCGHEHWAWAKQRVPSTPCLTAPHRSCPRLRLRLHRRSNVQTALALPHRKPRPLVRAALLRHPLVAAGCYHRRHRHRPCGCTSPCVPLGRPWAPRGVHRVSRPLPAASALPTRCQACQTLSCGLHGSLHGGCCACMPTRRHC